MLRRISFCLLLFLAAQAYACPAAAAPITWIPAAAPGLALDGFAARDFSPDPLPLQADNGGESFAENLGRDFWADFSRLYSGPAGIAAPETIFWLSSVALMLHFDQAAYDFFHTQLNSPEIEAASGWFSALGNGLSVLCLTGLVWLNDPETGLDCLEAVCFTGVNVQLCKYLLGMARPYLDRGPICIGPTLADGYDAMPSGHTAVAFALATVLAAKYPRYGWLFYTVATLVGLSRIYQQAHWPSNILAGAVFGIYGGQRVLGQEFTILRW